MQPDSRVFVAGHRGLVGSAISRKLRIAGFSQILERTRAQVDLTRQVDVESFFAAENPEYVFLAAARVGGILANSTRPAEFIHQNLLIQINVMDAAFRYGTRKLVFLGSSCIYPKFAPQPIREEYLLSGTLEPTNEAYAVAKIAGIAMAQAYRRQYGFRAISLMPTNLYGPGDNFDLESSHVLPAMIRRFHEAKEVGIPAVSIWGTGTPRREFLHVDDLADAAVHLMNTYDEESIVNVGTGEDIPIGELAEMVARIVGFEGKIINDLSKPDGTPRKLLDVSKLSDFGWRAKISLADGIWQTYQWFLANKVVDRLFV